MDIERILADDALRFMVIVCCLLGLTAISFFVAGSFPGTVWLARRRAQAVASRRWYFLEKAWTRSGCKITVNSVDAPRTSRTFSFDSPHESLDIIHGLRDLDVIELEYHRNAHPHIIRNRMCAYLTVKKSGHF